MPIYIYRGGSPNPQPQNPLLRFMVSIGVLAAVIGLGVLLLPVIGAITLIILGIIALLVLGGVIYRWIYGNPLDNFYQKQQGVRINPEARPDTEPARQQTNTTRARHMRFRSQRQTVEDAVVVEERKREEP